MSEQPSIAEKDVPLTATEPGATYRVVRAAKDRHCGDGTATYPMPCPRTIRKGEQYVRAVQFKNHDVYAWIDRDTRQPLTRPMVTDMCFSCAGHYHTTGLLVIDAERRASRVTSPAECDGCLCPTEHDGDYGSSGHAGPCPPHTCGLPPGGGRA